MRLAFRARTRAFFLEIHPVTDSRSSATALGAGMSLLLALGACSTVENMAAGDKVDYRGSATISKTNAL